MRNQLFSKQELANYFREEGKLSFVMTCPQLKSGEYVFLSQMVAAISKEYPASQRLVDPRELGMLPLVEEPFVFAVLSIEHADINSVSRELTTILSEVAQTRHRPLDNYGFFVSGFGERARKRDLDVTCHSFQHHPGVFYRFRYRPSRLNAIPESLKDLILSIPTACPHSLFTRSDNVRASAQELVHESKLVHNSEHDVVRYCSASADFSLYKQRHENVERYFLDSDEHCIATEVPLWSVAEIPRFPVLTGHVDILRFNFDKVEIWDYKPKAREEKTADLQVQLYCEMMALRTGLPLRQFVAGFFDEKDAYSFEPASFVYL